MTHMISKNDYETGHLQANNGKFVDNFNGEKPLEASSQRRSQTTSFDIHDKGNGKVVLKSWEGNYVSSQNGDGPMTCNSFSAGSWETFEMITHREDGSRSFKGNNGKYVSSENGDGPMTCNSDSIGAWETFRFN